MMRSLLLFIWAIAVSAVAAEEVDFNRDVRPILSENCYHCHGPDAKTREADLRLDTRQGLFAPRDDVRVVVPGKADHSELWLRLVSSDDDERMPPPDSKLTLTEAERGVLKKWIESGAPWSGHWSFERIAKPPVPETTTAWPRNEIDRFVLARLKKEKQSPSPPAIKERWLRRVTLDLTGLPPTLEELDAFLADASRGAHEKVADRLLASPAYGERMAWDWLDAARYADSNGFQGDADRTMWPWRNWVIDSLNENMPFDRFTVLQLAGDL
ncbi:MAG: DUF1549 domain-containing protein, partial [Planctomycetales bacterium]